MKHIFIVNPAAGKASTAEILKEELSRVGEGYDWEIYETQAPEDATLFVKKTCTENPDTVYRFYACGGDGTISEVVTGAIGFANASVGCYPCGSGNDFVKVYGGTERFLDVKALMDAEEETIDAIRVGDRYSLNITNFGFDTTVAKTIQKVRRKKILGGKRAYTTGVVTAIFTAMRNKCTVEADGEVINPKGKMLLCTVANGEYVGGSFHCAPRANVKDGLLEVCLFHPVNIFRFLKLLPVYTEGKHLDDEKTQKIMEYRRVKSVHVTAPEGFAYSLDGEIVYSSDFVCEVVPAAVRFAVPPMPAKKTESNEEAAQAEKATV